MGVQPIKDPKQPIFTAFLWAQRVELTAVFILNSRRGYFRKNSRLNHTESTFTYTVSIYLFDLKVVFYVFFLFNTSATTVPSWVLVGCTDACNDKTCLHSPLSSASIFQMHDSCSVQQVTKILICKIIPKCCSQDPETAIRWTTWGVSRAGLLGRDESSSS